MPLLITTPSLIEHHIFAKKHLFISWKWAKFEFNASIKPLEFNGMSAHYRRGYGIYRLALSCLNNKTCINTSDSPYLMDPIGLRMTNNASFSLLTHTKQLLLVTFCYTTTGIGSVTWWDVTWWDHHKDGQTWMMK